MELQIVRTRHPPDAYLEQLTALLNSETADLTIEDLRRRMELLPSEDRFFLALDGETLIGYAHLRTARDLVTDESAELVDIIVTPELRRQGIGRRLMTAAETWAFQAERSSLIVRADVVRSEALAFFAALGYKSSSTSQEHIRDLEAARRAEAPTQPQ